MMNVWQLPFDTSKRKGNLHIKLKGVFTPETAKMLSVAMEKSYQGKGNIFVHTKEVTLVEPDSKHIFSSLLSDTSLPKEKVYFTGEKGFDMVYDGSRVILRKLKGHCKSGCGKRKTCTAPENKS